MKWLRRIFKTDRPEENPATDLTISGLGAWLDEQSYSPEFEARAEELYSQIKGLSGELEEDLRSLKAAVPDQSIRPRLLNAGLAARDAVMNQLGELVEKMAPPEAPGIDSASDYHSSIVKHLGNTAMKFGRAKSYATALFPDQLKKINADLGMLTRILSDLGQEIERRQEEQSRIRSSRDLLSRVVEARGKAQELRNEIDDLEGKLEGLQALEDTIRMDLNALASSDEGIRTRALQDELGLTRDEAVLVKAEMSGLVSPLSKAISRMVKLDASDRLNLDHRRTLEVLSRSPEEARAGDIAGALLELKANLESLGMKEKQREKIVGHVDMLLESKALEDINSRYAQLSKETLDLETSLSESCQRSMELERSLADAERRRQGIDAGIARSRESLATVEDRASRDEAELKGLVQTIAGRPVPITDDHGRNI